MPNPFHYPKRKAAPAKLRAYKRHWEAIANVQGELNSQWIHAKLQDKDVADEAQLSRATVQRFRQWGRGQGKMSYSFFHGPAATTIFGIADALGMEVTVQLKRPR